MVNTENTENVVCPYDGCTEEFNLLVFDRPSERIEDLPEGAEIWTEEAERFDGYSQEEPAEDRDLGPEVDDEGGMTEYRPDAPEE